jgi:dTDP-4-dehydrorhamnose reductase
MNVLITGAAGQLGHTLVASAPASVNVTAADANDFDIVSRDAVFGAVKKLKPAVIINAAAYTQVDQAETERERAYAVNAEGPGYLANAAQETGARFIHISTDYVFDGRQTRPYIPTDPTLPIGIYGASKLEGEQRALTQCTRTIVIRTAWLYASNGNNFVHTMLKLMRERDELRVVADQIGAPTWATTLASVIWMGAYNSALRGVYHWTDAGSTSRHGFATAIQEEAIKNGLLTRQVPIHAIRTDEYPTPAKRPPYSVLDSRGTVTDFGVAQTPWRLALRQMLKEVARA